METAVSKDPRAQHKGAEMHVGAEEQQEWQQFPFSPTVQMCTERTAAERAAWLQGIKGHLVPELHSQVMSASEEELLKDKE